MSSSQYTIYRSTDAGGPGPITGTTGSLITILDACLINGYSGKPTAGWTKPFANSGSSGGYVNASGSNAGMYVNDNAPHGIALAKEAWVIGWQTLVGATSSFNIEGSSSIGGGQGNFPNSSQGLGHLVIRKSTTADSTARQWMIIADPYTCYLFIQTGDAANTYYPFMFGDFFSLYSSTDSFRSVIMGRSIDNSAAINNSAVLVDGLDIMSQGTTTGVGGTKTCGPWVCGTLSAPSSLLHNIIGDLAKGSSIAGLNLGSNTQFYWVMAGIVQTPNSPDNSYYLSPLFLMDTTSAVGTLRGRFRGLYQVCHSPSSFTDGQLFSGGNDYAGKAFMIIKSGPNGGFWAIETSNTVETN